MADLESLKAKIRVLPNKPGVYQYYNDEGTILYVGKAKDLKKRVASYFNKNLDSGKTRVLVRQIAEIKYIVVDTELDALLLENNLIKKYQPKYNIQLKDDKTYPWICIKKETLSKNLHNAQDNQRWIKILWAISKCESHQHLNFPNSRGVSFANVYLGFI